jgi:glucosamine--fructose-6-phosphate aminotransferase (isomerizing)
VINNENQIINCARYLSKYNNVFLVGRGINVPIALEGALKLKEIAYMRAEGYAAGELKHGPLALLDRDTPVIAIATRDNTYDVLLTNIKEMKARNAPVIALAEETDGVIGEFVDSVIRVPDVTGLFSPMVNAVALQLLAYHTAQQKGCPIDFPRNLAKSVTVE